MAPLRLCVVETIVWERAARRVRLLRTRSKIGRRESGGGRGSLAERIEMGETDGRRSYENALVFTDPSPRGNR